MKAAEGQQQGGGFDRRTSSVADDPDGSLAGAGQDGGEAQGSLKHPGW